MAVSIFRLQFANYMAMRYDKSKNMTQQEQNGLPLGEQDAWKQLNTAFFNLSPDDSFGNCECGGEILWKKRTRGWAALCNLCAAEWYRFPPP